MIREKPVEMQILKPFLNTVMGNNVTINCNFEIYCH